MSLPEEKTDNLFSANNTLKNLLPEDDPMILFSEEIYPLFTDEDFEDCYSKKGRNAISPAFLSLVTILQWKESLSDPEVTEACIRRLDWKIALHLPIDYKETFDPSTLCYFRRRLKENNKMNLIFDKILYLAEKKGFIKKRSKQRIDATHIISHINRISTTDLLFRSVKCLVEEIEGKDRRYYERNIPEAIKERYSQRFSSFGLSKAKRWEKQAEIVEDGLYLKYILTKEASKRLRELKQLRIMEIIFSENVIIKEKEINDKIFIEVEEIKNPRQSIFDPRDQSIKLGKKGKLSWVGSKCHVVETAEKGQVNFIVNMLQQEASGSDQSMHSKIREGNDAKGLSPRKVFVDTNYVSGTSIKEYEKRGEKLMGYINHGNYKKKHINFQLRKFKIDVSTKEAVCPMGHKSSRWIELKNQPKYGIYFSRRACSECKYKKECAGEKRKRKFFQVHKDYEYIKRRRRQQESKRFKEEMKARPQIEGTVSELVRFHGLRQAKYKGEKGRQLQYLLAACGLNIKRFFKAYKMKFCTQVSI